MAAGQQLVKSRAGQSVHIILTAAMEIYANLNIGTGTGTGTGTGIGTGPR